MDPWESQQQSWTRTAKVLRHHQAILDGTVTNKMNNPAPRLIADGRLKIMNRDVIHK
jgi:hypothetical protein